MAPSSARKRNLSSSPKKNQSNITSFTGKKTNTQKSPSRSGRGGGRLPKPAVERNTNVSNSRTSDTNTNILLDTNDSQNPFAPLADMEVDMESEDTSKTPVTGNAKPLDNSVDEDHHSSTNESDSSEGSNTSSSNNIEDGYTPNLSDNAKKSSRNSKTG